MTSYRDSFTFTFNLVLLVHSMIALSKHNTDEKLQPYIRIHNIHIVTISF
jgi:hypothetical protein